MKLLLLFSIFVILFISLYFRMLYLNNDANIKPTGKIMYYNRPGGIYIRNFTNGTKNIFISKEEVFDPLFIDQGEKAIFVSYRIKQDKSDYISDIKIYDFSSNKLETIISLKGQVRYPSLMKNNRLTFVDTDYRLHLFDLSDNKDTIYQEMGFLDNTNNTTASVSWGEQDETLVFSSSGKIYKFDLKNKQKLYLTDGFTPVFFKDCSQVAYITNRGQIGIIKFNGFKRIYQNLKNVRDLELSPDGKHIAFDSFNQKTLNHNQHDLFILEINSGKTIQIDSYRGPRRLSWSQ